MSYAESFAEFDRWWDTLRLTRDENAVIEAIESAIRHEPDPERRGILHGLLYQEYVVQRRPDAAAAIGGLYPEAVRAHETHSRIRHKSSAAARRQIDDKVLSFVKQRWRKVARIVGEVLQACERDNVATSGTQIARRIAALAAGGRLDVQGSVAHWRYGEVRLRDTLTAPEPGRESPRTSAERVDASVIAKRKLTMKVGSRDVEVPITIHAPADKGDHWCCTFEIGWPDKPKQGSANGVDAFQALSIALQFIGADLYTSKPHDAGKLRWTKRSTGYGFPLPWALHVLAEGEDRFL